MYFSPNAATPEFVSSKFCRYTGTPLLFVIIGLAVRSEYYGVRGDDGELAL